MRIKKDLGNLIKGWLPREQKIPTQKLQQFTLKKESSLLITGTGMGLVSLGVGFCFFSSYHIDGNLPVEVILNVISHYLMGIAVGCAFLVIGVFLVVFGIKKQSQNRFSLQAQTEKNFINGWFPKEPALSTCQTSVYSKFSVFVRRIAIVVVASVAGAVLGVAGDIFGLDKGIGVFVWPVTTVVIVGAGVGLFAVYMQRKLGLGARN